MGGVHPTNCTQRVITHLAFDRLKGRDNPRTTSLCARMPRVFLGCSQFNTRFCFSGISLVPSQHSKSCFGEQSSISLIEQSLTQDNNSVVV